MDDPSAMVNFFHKMDTHAIHDDLLGDELLAVHGAARDHFFCMIHT